MTCRKKMTSDPANISGALEDTTSESTGKSSCDLDDRTSKSTEDVASDPSEDTTGIKRPITSVPGVDLNLTSDPGVDRPRKRVRVQAAASRLLPISSGASESCSEVLHRMNQDYVSHQVCPSVRLCEGGEMT